MKAGDGMVALGEYGEGEIVLPPSPYPDVLGDWSGKRPDITDSNAAMVTVAEQLAWATMLRLTAYQVVVAPVTVRPMCEFCARRTWLSDTVGFTIGGLVPWDSMLFRGFGSWATCGYGHYSLPLPRPVGRIVEVKVDGQVVSTDSYRVDNGNELTRLDGQTWPTFQSPQTPVDEATAFTLTYYPGYRPDAPFVWATGVLASEFYLAINPQPGKQKCRLPSGVTSVVRQGVSYEIDEVPFSNGRTGITEIDVVLARYNPNGLTARPVVLSPDSLRRRPRMLGV